MPTQIRSIVIPDAESLIRDIIKNLREYAISFSVSKLNYKECTFTLTDDEGGGKSYDIDMPMLIEGLCVFVKALENAAKYKEDPVKYKDIQPRYFNAGMGLDKVNDPGCWDSFDLDALLQCAALGEIIYG